VLLKVAELSKHQTNGLIYFSFCIAPHARAMVSLFRNVKWSAAKLGFKPTKKQL